jgi:hypothetical protein
MKVAEHKGRISLAISRLTGFEAVLAFGNGLFMFGTPQAWYYAVPGVTGTGFFNQHFIRDIGIIYLLISIAFAIGIVRPARRVELWAPQPSGLPVMQYTLSGKSRWASALRQRSTATFRE